MAHRKLLSHSLSASAAVVLGGGGAAAIISCATALDDPTQADNRSLKNVFVQPTTHIFGSLRLDQLKVSSTHRALCEKAISETESQRFERALAHHRSKISSYREKWEYRADSSATTSTKTPSRSWPDDVPSNDDLPFLLEDVKYCNRSPNFKGDKEAIKINDAGWPVAKRGEA